MPIKKGTTVGENTNTTQVIFGTGDILVSNGYDGENSKVKVLVFGQDVPKPVSEYNKTVEVIGGSTDGVKDPVILYFDKVESVDVVLDRLLSVRADLLNELE